VIIPENEPARARPRRWWLWLSVLAALATAGSAVGTWRAIERQKAERDRQACACDSSAWLEATRVRWFNPQGALKLASRACELTDWRNPSYLDTLAAACAANADFDAARDWEQKAIERERNGKLIREYQLRLALYAAKKPYRVEEWNDAIVEAMMKIWKSGKE
jgi:hypothetical protein